MESTKSGPSLRSYYLTPQLSYRRREVKRIRCHSSCRPNRTSSKVSGNFSSNNNQLQQQQQKLKTSSNLSLLVVDKTLVDLQISDLNNNETTIVNLSWNIEEPTNMLDWIGLYLIGEKNPFRYLDYKCNNSCSKADGAFTWKLGYDLIEKLRPNVSCSGLQSKCNHELRIFHEAENKILYKSGSQHGACPSWNLSDIEITCQNRIGADSIVFEIKSESRSRKASSSLQCSISTDQLCEELESKNILALEINLRLKEEFRCGEMEKVSKDPILTFYVQNAVIDIAGNDTTTNNNDDQSGTQIGIGKNISCFPNERFNNDPSRLNDDHVTNDILSGNTGSSSSESDTEMTLRLRNEDNKKHDADQHGDYSNDKPGANTSLEIGRAVSQKASRSVKDYSGEDLVLVVLEGEEESKGAYGSSGAVDNATVMITSPNATFTKNRVESGYTTDSSASNSEITQKSRSNDQKITGKSLSPSAPSTEKPSTSNAPCSTSLYVDAAAVVGESPAMSSASPDATSHWPPYRTSDSGISQNLSDESVASTGNNRLLQQPFGDPHSKTRSVPQTPVSYPKFCRRRPDTLNLNVADHLICGSCLRNPVVVFDRPTEKTAVEFNCNENDPIQPSTSFSSSSPIFRSCGQKLKILLKNSPCPDCNALKRNFSSTKTTTTTPVESSTSKNGENFVQNGIDQLDMILPAFCEARIDAHGRIFYVDHLNKTTSWHRPKLFKQGVENVRKLDKNKRVICHRKTIGSAFERPDGPERTSILPTEWPAITFLLRPDFISLLQSNNKAKEIYDNSQGVRHIIHRIRKDNNKFERFQYNKDLVALLNEFADQTQGMPTEWELKVDVSGREFFIDHKFKRTTFIDPRLPKNFVFQRRHRAKSAPPADSKNGGTDFEQLTYNDKVVRFLRKPGSIEFIFSRLTHQYNQAKLKRKLETISKSGVQALKKYVNDVDFIMALSTCEEEILSDTTYLTAVEKSSSVSKVSDFDLKLTDFYLRLGENGFGQGPEKINLIIRRKYLLTDAFDSIMTLKKRDLQMSKLYINFDDEAGLDYGGPSREFFFLLSRELFNPYYGFFEYSSNKVYNVQISPMSIFVENHLDWFRFSGRILALALMHRFLIDVFFTRAFYKLLLKKACSIADLEGSDDQFYSSLLWLQTNEVSPDLELTFSVNEEIGGQILEKELIPNGSKVVVEESNKMEYINHLIKWRLERGVRKQSNSLLRGFYELIDSNMISVFDAPELELILSGTVEIDIGDWRRNTEYKGGFNDDHVVIFWFWQAIEKFTNSQRLLLLQFVTGTSSIPCEGFSALRGSHGPKKFTIERWGNPTSLPRAHTCFNRLDLPAYPSFSVLYKKLSIAIEESSAYGMD